MYKGYLAFILFILLIGANTLKLDMISFNEIEKAVYDIEIKGAVLNPGVYKTDKFTSMETLLNKAGLLESADISHINLTQIPTPGSVITIKDKDSLKEVLISINSASLSELDTLPGIGPSIGAKIIEYREKNSGFKNIEEIKNVAGIGEKTYEKLKDLITL